jgi:protocatechuate 3,4-dioxygenase beta subunit
MSTRPIGRREAFSLMGASATAALAFGCVGSTSPSDADPTTLAAQSTGSTGSTCAITPTETIGPFPSLSKLVRSDIREDQPGTALTLVIKVVNVEAGCAAVANANVEVWHADVWGRYSEYGSQTAETYLRGIQTTDREGMVTFVTNYPGWYAGRASHIHLEVTIGGVSRKVTQIAFPEVANKAVYSSGIYAARGANPTSNLQDGIFADSLESELMTVLGNTTSGFTAKYQVGISL